MSASRLLGQRGVTAVLPLGDTGTQRVQVVAGAESELQRALRGDPNVEFAQLDHRRQVSAEPNDPLYANSQWGLTKIAMPDAWSVVTGTGSVVIAVIDTGLDSNHPDLVDRVLPGRSFVNWFVGTVKVTPGTPGMMPMGTYSVRVTGRSGAVETLPSNPVAASVTGTRSIQISFPPQTGATSYGIYLGSPNNEGKLVGVVTTTTYTVTQLAPADAPGPPQRGAVLAPDNSADDHGHGTKVAGVAAAAGNNGLGISGVS